LNVAIVVSDTSPIRALAHLGLMELLLELFSEVLIPPAVESELRNAVPGMVSVAVAEFPFIRVQAPTDLERVSENPKRSPSHWRSVPI
jgi:predicted nucleic acid-binding protein